MWDCFGLPGTCRHWVHTHACTHAHNGSTEAPSTCMPAVSCAVQVGAIVPGRFRPYWAPAGRWRGQEPDGSHGGLRRSPELSLLQLHQARVPLYKDRRGSVPLALVLSARLAETMLQFTVGTFFKHNLKDGGVSNIFCRSD